jgi:ribulose-bisphosphate carboxylase large chain
VMIVPMIAGWSTMQTLVRQYPDVAFIGHPSFGGAARIAPDLLIGKLFRMLGADAVIFPNYGGRFGYTSEHCRRLVERSRMTIEGVLPSMPVPAGGMTLDRVPELLDFYGPDTMLLIGGSLLAARERLTEETVAFIHLVAQHRYRQEVDGH